jgi:hypothetical protein
MSGNEDLRKYSDLRSNKSIIRGTNEELRHFYIGHLLVLGH